MELFKKNPYTREEAEQAEREQKEIWMWDIGSRRILEARTRLNMMVRAGHAEAVGLNNEHERLINKVKTASEELLQFEKGRLGMHKSEETKDS